MSQAHASRVVGEKRAAVGFRGEERKQAFAGGRAGWLEIADLSQSHLKISLSWNTQCSRPKLTFTVLICAARWTLNI